MTQELDAETKLLAAMTYGESSTQNDSDEMFAIASVLVRQRDARGYSDMQSFTSSEPTFSFVVGDKNPRYKLFNKSKDSAISANKGMSMAVDAAKNALAYGEDKSNGAYFWDGTDIKSNYSNHFKVKNGIKIISPEHNVHDLADSQKLVIKNRVTRKKVNGKVTIETTEIYRYDHVYESTAGYGGTIFWKNSPDYVKFTKAKEYK